MIYAADTLEKSGHIVLENGERCVQVFQNTDHRIIIFNGSLRLIQRHLRVEWTVTNGRNFMVESHKTGTIRESVCVCVCVHKKRDLVGVQAAILMATKEECLPTMVADAFVADTLIVHALRVAGQHARFEVFFQPVRVGQRQIGKGLFPLHKIPWRTNIVKPTDDTFDGITHQVHVNRLWAPKSTIINKQICK